MLLDATSRILKKKRELTAIIIDYIDPDCWLISGSTLYEQYGHAEQILVVYGLHAN